MTDQQNTTLNAFFQSIRDYDEAALVALFTDDAVIHSVTDPVYHGVSGVKKMLTDLSRRYVDFTIQPLRTVSEGDTAATEWTVTITDFGGGQSRLDGCAVVDFTDARIHRLRLYWRPEDAQG